jgi:hypothetical protein
VLPTVRCIGIDATVIADPDAIGFALSQASINYFAKCQTGYDLSDVTPASLAASFQKVPFPTSAFGGSREATELVSAISEAKNNSKKTPGGLGGITLKAAQILSTNPEGVRNEGTIYLYNRMLTDREAWGRCNRENMLTQLTSEQFLQLIQNPSSVSILLLASLTDEMSLQEAVLLQEKYGRAEVDKSLVPNMHIIGNNLEKLRNTLLNFLFVYVTALDLKQDILDAFLQMVERHLRYTAVRLDGPYNNSTNKKLIIVAEHIQRVFTGVYMRVYSGVISSTGQLIREIEDLTIETDSPLSIEFMKLSMISPPRGNDASSNGDRKKRRTNKKRDEDKQPPADVVIKADRPPPISVCGYNLSTKGCVKKNGQCALPHQQPKPGAESKAVDAWFKHMDRLTRG